MSDPRHIGTDPITKQIVDKLYGEKLSEAERLQLELDAALAKLAEVEAERDHWKERWALADAHLVRAMRNNALLRNGLPLDHSPVQPPVHTQGR